MAWSLRPEGECRHGDVTALSARAFGRRLALTVAISLVVSTEVFFRPPAAFGDTFQRDLWRWPSHVVECLLMGAVVMLALTLVETANRDWRRPAAWVLYAAALVASALLGEMLLLALQGLDWSALRTRRFWSDAVFWMAIGHANATIHFLKQRAAEASEALIEVQMRRVVLQRHAQEARLNVLRAQIEPHFLFNALANMRRLCRNDVGSGIAMLQNIGRYLSAALPGMHHAQATLGQEADLVSAYLAIVKVRMGARLRYVVDIPGGLGGRLFPSMMLLTLAENAIKHGLAPVPQGGSIAIRARTEENLLVVSIADDGVGFAAAPTGGCGSGLANIRERLAAMYGDAGSLVLASNPASGVTATIRMPLPPRATPEQD